MPFLLNVRSLALVSALLIVLGGTALASPQPVSGYEIFLGYNCTIKGEAATCGATFSGWTGGTGQNSGGWVPFPGTGLGTWSIRVNYTGQPAFGSSVNIVGGTWSFLLFNSTFLHGKVVSGTVTWPEEGTSSACGLNVAVAEANLSVAGGSTTSVTGCLHDLPKGSVIPPQIWGTFTF